MTGKIKKTILLAAILLLSFHTLFTQTITEGKIVYERKTNLYKKYKSWGDLKEWLPEVDKTKTDVFELYFNDTLSAFVPQENDLKESMSWATSKGSVYQDFKSKKRFSIKSIWGDKLNVDDTLYSRVWKITDSKRTICGHLCRKAIWKANDTTRIYAWFTDDIVAEVGPESFFGLPGAILGVATEDGGVIYFAKSVEAVKPDLSQLKSRKTKGKVYTSKELKDKLEKDYGKEKWGKAMIANFFGLF